MRTTRRPILPAALAAALALGGTLAVAAPAGAATTGTSKVSVLHGVPGLTVDVFVNGDEVVSDFEPGDLAGPLDLPAGEYDLAVFPAGEGPDGTPAIEANDVAVPGGANITVAAHLNADGEPVLTPFVNDVSSVDAGEARLTVRHTAAAPAVDVRAGGSPVFEGLTNPNEESADIAAGTVSADVVLAGTDTVAIGPADVALAEGTSTIVYAWGSAEDENLDLAVQTIEGLHSAPAGVPSGSGGLAQDVMPLSLLALTAGGLLALVVGGTRARVARTRR